MNETYVTVSGNVVGDPVVRATRANVSFVTFRVASNARRVDSKTGEYIDAGTNFVNVTAFRALGVNVSNSLKKGEPVIVYGRMRINQWVNGERSGTTVEIDAYNAVSYTHLRAHETVLDLVCRLLLEKKKTHK